MSGDFSPEQKRYLEGFTSGLQIARAGRGLGGKPAVQVPSGPDAEHIAAQDRTVAAGGKLNDQEKFKREQHPFDAYGRLKEQAATNTPPKPAACPCAGRPYTRASARLGTPAVAGLLRR